ncbi:MAG: hypothetical protein AB1393_07070 [Candidatus Edwardsbacteria bacterium]
MMSILLRRILQVVPYGRGPLAELILMRAGLSSRPLMADISLQDIPSLLVRAMAMSILLKRILQVIPYGRGLLAEVAMIGASLSGRPLMVDISLQDIPPLLVQACMMSIL